MARIDDITKIRNTIFSNTPRNTPEANQPPPIELYDFINSILSPAKGVNARNLSDKEIQEISENPNLAFAMYNFFTGKISAGEQTTPADCLENGTARLEKETAAALKIQTAFRGNKARKDAQAKKDTTVKTPIATEEERQAAAVKIQAAWRGFQARKRLDKLNNPDNPDNQNPPPPIAPPEETPETDPAIAEQCPGSDIKSKDGMTIMHRNDRRQELGLATDKDHPFTKSTVVIYKNSDGTDSSKKTIYKEHKIEHFSNPLENFTGYIKHNGKDSSDLLHDHIEMDEYGVMRVKHDVTAAASEVIYQNHLNRTLGQVTGTNRATLGGSYQFIEFDGTYSEDTNWNKSSLGANIDDYKTRASELLYIDPDTGRTIRYIGADQSIEGQSLMSRQKESIKENNNLTKEEQDLLFKIALKGNSDGFPVDHKDAGLKITELLKPHLKASEDKRKKEFIKTEIEKSDDEISAEIKDLLPNKPEGKSYTDFYNESSKEIKGKVDAKILETLPAKTPPTKEEFEAIFEGDADLKNKLDLEIKLSKRAGFQKLRKDQLSDEEGTELKGEARYTQLNAINRHLNREKGTEFIKNEFQHQKINFQENQGEALKTFKKSLLKGLDTSGGTDKTHICQDLENLPLVGRGVSSTTRYTGLGGGNLEGSTITKVVFNDCEKENEEKLINIPGTEAYIMVKLNRAGAGSDSSEDKTEVVENRVYMKKQVIVDGSKPIRFYTTYESFKVHDNNITGPSVSKELLKSGMPTTDAKRIAKAYSKMGVEAYSVKNGVLQSMSVKVAGKKRGGHKDIALSDVAKDVTVDQVAKISNLYEDHFATADEDGNYTKMTPKEKANLKSKIQELEENVSRGFRGQGVRIKSFQELSQGLYGQPLAEVSARGPAGKSPKNAINALKKNFDTNLAIDMKRLFADTPQDNPIALEFLRQVAQYAVIRANSINEMTSVGGDQRRRLFDEVFDLSSSALNNKGINIAPNDLQDILMENIKGFSKAKGEKVWSHSPRPVGYNKMPTRASQGYDKFSSAKGGYRKDLRDHENAALAILIQYNDTKEPLSTEAMDVIKSLPETSLQEVIEGFKEATGDKNHKIPTPETSQTNPTFAAESLKRRIFDYTLPEDYAPGNRHPETYTPIDPKNNPIHLMQTRQFNREMAKWIVQAGKDEFNSHEGNYFMASREDFIDDATNIATTSIENILDSTVGNRPTKEELTENLTTSTRQQAAQLKSETRPSPSMSATKLGKIANGERKPGKYVPQEAVRDWRSKISKQNNDASRDEVEGGMSL